MTEYWNVLVCFAANGLKSASDVVNDVFKTEAEARECVKKWESSPRAYVVELCVNDRREYSYPNGTPTAFLFKHKYGVRGFSDYLRSLASVAENAATTAHSDALRHGDENAAMRATTDAAAAAAEELAADLETLLRNS